MLKDLGEEEFGPFVLGIMEEAFRGGVFNDDTFIHEEDFVSG